jgi:hypothetical protein
MWAGIVGTPGMAAELCRPSEVAASSAGPGAGEGLAGVHRWLSGFPALWAGNDCHESTTLSVLVLSIISTVNHVERGVF